MQRAESREPTPTQDHLLGVTAMKSEISYYLILVVYILLWSCQLVACHLTHSLIILTDSYINIYRIIDISVGLLHLKTQRTLVENKNRVSISGRSDNVPTEYQHQQPVDMAGKLFNCVCTYQFKRLALLGSFMNGLFLAALLISAAIEGIQTCFHTSHLAGNDEKSILLTNPVTYPLILVGFALVGLMMQYCSGKAHELREEELCSESLLDLLEPSSSSGGVSASSSSPQSLRSNRQSNDMMQVPMRELDAKNLVTSDKIKCLKAPSSLDDGVMTSSKTSNNRRKYDLNQARNNKFSKNASFESIPLDVSSNNGDTNCLKDSKKGSQVSLKSLKFTVNLECLPNVDSESGGCPKVLNPKDVKKLANDEKTINSISMNINATDDGQDLTASNKDLEKAIMMKSKSGTKTADKWFYVRYFTSPVALITCAMIFYFMDDNLITEVADALLAVIVVSLLFAASYPPMKKAGRVLLQTAPDGVDLLKLERELKSTSPYIIRVKDLKVWSLTPRSNRVATCQLVLDPNSVRTEREVIRLLTETKMKFLKQNIKCTTIEPLFETKHDEPELDINRRSIK